MQVWRAMALASATALAMSGSVGAAQAIGKSPQDTGSHSGGAATDTGAYGSPRAQQDASSQQGRLDSRSRDFLTQAVQTNLLEVQLAQLASERATDSRVRRFANEVLRYHQNATKRLETMSSSLGVALPSSLDERFRAQVDELSSLSGRDFDDHFVTAMERIHQDAIGNYETMANAPQVNPELRRWSADALPHLRERVQQVRALEQELHGKGSAQDPGAGGEHQEDGGMQGGQSY